MEIRPVPMTQIVRGRDGRQYEVSGDAGGIAMDLQAIDPSLEVHFNDQGFFVILQTVPDGPRKGAKEVVMRVPADDWDQRVVRDMRMRNYELRHGHSVADRLDREDDARTAALDRQYEASVAELAGPLFHAIQRDVLGARPRIFIPEKKRKPAAAAA